MAQFTTLTSRVLPLPINDVDTDQIIPAQFLKITDKEGLADLLFFHWRFHDDGSPKMDFVINKPEYRGARILLAGDNFWLWLEPRACTLGADSLWVSGSHLHIFCRYFP